MNLEAKTAETLYQLRRAVVLNKRVIRLGNRRLSEAEKAKNRAEILRGEK